MDFKQLDSDFAAFIKRENDGKFTIILSYVDDLLFISNDNDMQVSEINNFLDKFEGTQENLK